MEKDTSARQQSAGPAGKSVEFLIGDDLRVARLGFGLMRLTGKGIWGEPADRPEAIRVLRRAVELRELISSTLRTPTARIRPKKLLPRLCIPTRQAW